MASRFALRMLLKARAGCRRALSFLAAGLSSHGWANMSHAWSLMLKQYYRSLNEALLGFILTVPHVECNEGRSMVPCGLGVG